MLEGNDPCKRCAGRVSLGLPNNGVEASRVALPYGHASIDSRLFLPCMAHLIKPDGGVGAAAGAGEAWMERVKTPFRLGEVAPSGRGRKSQAPITAREAAELWGDLASHSGLSTQRCCC